MAIRLGGSLGVTHEVRIIGPAGSDAARFGHLGDPRGCRNFKVLEPGIVFYRRIASAPHTLHKEKTERSGEDELSVITRTNASFAAP